VSAVLLGHRPGVAQLRDAALLAVPGVGSLVRSAELERLYALLGALIEAGLDLDAALALAEPTAGNRELRRRLQALRAHVRRGEPLSRALERARIDGSGEDAATLRAAEAGRGYAGALARLAATHANLRRARTAALLGAAEPAAVALMAILVGAVVLAIYEPILGGATSIAGIGP